MDRKEILAGHVKGTISEVILDKEEEHFYCPCCNEVLDQPLQEVLCYAWSEEETITDGNHFVHFLHEECQGTIAVKYMVENGRFQITEIKILNMKKQTHVKRTWRGIMH